LEEMPREEPQGKPSDLHKRLFHYIVAVEEGKSLSFEDSIMKKVADDRDARETAKKQRREDSATLPDKANNIAKTLADTFPFEGTSMIDWLGAESGMILLLGLDTAWTGQTTSRQTPNERTCWASPLPTTRQWSTSWGNTHSSASLPAQPFLSSAPFPPQNADSSE
jgi:hypothetical protein